jgi:hypothetical protein
MVVSIPVALIFGIIGIVRDEQKLLAIITTVIAGGLVGFYVLMMLYLGLSLC